MNAASDLSTAPAKQVVTITDSISFTINETDLPENKNGEFFETQKRAVSCSSGLHYWLKYYPAGWLENNKNFVSVFLWINKAVKTKWTVVVDGSSISRTFTYEFTNEKKSWGNCEYASHVQLRPLFHDGKLTMTCNIEFKISPPAITVPRNCQLFYHVPMDVEFVIGSERVPAHKSFLSLISPVLQAMFTHDTVESKSGEIEITEFDFDTVKTAIDFCYRRELDTLSAETTVGILHFCDKYLITPVVNELEKLPLLILSAENFCSIFQYAYDCNRESLLTACYNCFKKHQDEIKATEKFAKLPLTLVITVLKAAFDIKTDLEVLCHASKNDINFVVNYLEKPLIEPITLENFSAVATYAWDCSREELKQACAKYFNDNRDEVLDSEAFHMLPSDIVGNVQKAGYVLKRRRNVI